jgi:hypothetical protein
MSGSSVGSDGAGSCGLEGEAEEDVLYTGRVAIYKSQVRRVVCCWECTRVGADWGAHAVPQSRPDVVVTKHSAAPLASCPPLPL